jgi:hypothetical protein
MLAVMPRPTTLKHRTFRLALCWSLAAFGCVGAHAEPTTTQPAACAGRLPAAEIRVHVRHGIPHVHYERSAKEIWQLLGARPDTIALGLTETHTALSLELALHSQSANGQTCARPRIDVTMSHARIEVMLAREIQHESCVAELVLAHEMQHVAIERDALEFAARELQARMRQYYDERIYLGSVTQIVQQLTREHELHWAPQARRLLRTILARHGEHDEHDADADRQACEGALLAVSKQID